MNDLLDDVIEWAEKRNLFETATAQSQFVKMVEEVGEIAEVISKKQSRDALALEIGDLIVTATLLAEVHGLTLETCLKMAFNKISNRTGQVVDGVFIKDVEGNK